MAVLWTLVGVLCIVVLVGVSLYVPAVQRFALRKASEIVTEKTGMTLRAKELRLRFPLEVSVDGASLVAASGDTLAEAQRVRASVAPWPLLVGRVVARDVAVEGGRSLWRDSTGTLAVRSRLESFAASGVTLGIWGQSLEVAQGSVSGAVVALSLVTGRASTPRDTTARAPWRFDVGRLDLADVRFEMDLRSAADGTPSRIEAEIAAGSVRGVEVTLAEPLTVRGEAVELSGGGFVYRAALAVRRGVTFDPSNIVSRDIALRISDFTYKMNSAAGGAGEITARIEALTLAERSGLRIEAAAGDFAMTERGLALTDFSLSTAASRLDVTASIGMGVTRVEGSAPLAAKTGGTVGVADVGRFVSLPPSVRAAFGGEKVAISASVGGTLAAISVDRLTARVAGRLNLSASGTLRDVTVPRLLAASATFSGDSTDADFALGFIADTTLRRRISLPARMSFSGAGSFAADEVTLSRFVLEAGGEGASGPVLGASLPLASVVGRLEASGNYRLRSKTYDAAVLMSDFPLGDFLPRDSLGAATLRLAAHGQGFDPTAGMTATVDLTVDSLRYRRFTHRDVVLRLALTEGILDGRLTAAGEALAFDVALDGRFERGKYAAGIKGTIRRADLQRMGFAEEPLAFASKIDLRLEDIRQGPSYGLAATLDSTTLRTWNSTLRIAPTTLGAQAGVAGSSASVRSGDLSLDLSSPLALDSLIRGGMRAGGEVRRQLTARHFNADSLQSAFPEMTLRLGAGRANFVRGLARARGLDFRSLSADVATVAGEPFAIAATVKGLRTGRLAFDAMDLRARRNGENLDYALRLEGTPVGIENIGRIDLSGSAGGNQLTLNLVQQSSAGEVGFRFGARAALRGKTLHAEMTPANPILGYRQWQVGGGGWVEIDTDGSLRADLRLTGPEGGEHLNLTSASLPDMPQGALRLDAAGVVVTRMLDLFPTLPELGGTLASDLTFGFHPATSGNVIAARGGVGVKDFTWRGRRVADVGAEVDFHAAGKGQIALQADVRLDGKSALTATGTYTPAEMNVALDIAGVPLAAAEPFLPAELAVKLAGTFEGNLKATGSPSAPQFAGDVGMVGGRAEVGMMGTTLGISPSRITLDGGRLTLGDFGLVGPNGRALSITGGFDISNLARPRADIRVKGDNFQFVRSDHLSGSQLYGTALLDADITARGPLAALTVRGDVELAPTTDIVYIMRGQSRVRDMKQNIVEFTVFADSLEIDTPAGGTPYLSAGVDMLVGVTIGEGLRATLSLDEVNENRMELRGGGALTFSMSSVGDTRLAGRYTLSGGTFYYRPPVIAQKVFAVKEGSYVEWTGEAAKPQFHVSATQTMPVDVTYDDGGAQRVAFDIAVDVSGSLAALDIKFDLSAPGDIAIENQLRSMTPQARMQQALTLLVYKQYTAPGVATRRGVPIDARATLNDFIAKELNQWARNNLHGVDLSMGIITTSVDPANVHTDYSYSLSKSFSDRVKISIGGRVADNATAENFAGNLIDDVSLEYRLTRRDNMFLKVYRYNTRESILEGQVTETGAGFMMRKRVNRLGDVFRRTKKKKVVNDR